MIPWCFNLIYAALLLALSPLILYRRWRHGKYRRGNAEKWWGNLPRRHPERPSIWVHAVSVGEVLQLQALLPELGRRFSGHEILLTTTTETGYDVAVTKYPDVTCTFYPLDFTWAVNRALDRVRPDLIALVELELWPNFIAAAARRRIPLVLINGRISEKSFRGYRRIKPLMRWLLCQFRWLLVQTAEYGDRLRELGAPSDRVQVTGNIKFDRVQSDRQNPRTAALRREFGLRDEEVLFIAGSTQEPEESLAIEAYRELKPKFPGLRLMLVPRHKERFEEVAGLVQQSGFPLLRRTQTTAASSAAMADNNSSMPPSIAAENNRPILLLDTLGELGFAWGLADIAFVGGSLTQRGGQNMIEPAAYGAAVLFGPNTWNFKDIVAALLHHDAAQVVADGAGLTAALHHCLDDRTHRLAMGERARAFVADQHGATEATLKCLVETIATTQ